MITDNSLAGRIRTFRVNNGFTCANLAHSLGVKVSTVDRWETGSTRPSPIVAKRLTEMGFGEIRPEDTNADTQPRLNGRSASVKRAGALALKEGAEIPLQLGGGDVMIALPMSWMRNGPPDQEDFHKTMVTLQCKGLAKFSKEVASLRLSMIERVKGYGPTAQFSVEEPKPTAVAWNSNFGPHGWHRYIGRFPPHVVRALLNHFGAGPDDLVLDPFLGSGTTAVECRLLGIPFIGIEICPLSVMISRVKACFPEDLNLLQAVAKDFKSNYCHLWNRHLDGRHPNQLTHDETLRRTGNLVPRFVNIERWLTPEALLGVSCAVELAMKESGYVKEALLLALSAKMRSIGNIDVDVVRAEYRKKPREKVDVGRLISQQLKKMIGGIERSVRSHKDLLGKADKVTLFEGSALEVAVPSRSVSHIITSPPYGVETISYLRTHLLSYRTLIAHLGHDPYDTRAQTIGSEYVDERTKSDPKNARRNSRTFRKFFGVEEESEKLNARRHAMMCFFEDMFVLGERLAEWLVDCGRIAFIIGNKKLGNRIIPANLIIIELFKAVGLRHDLSIQHKLKTNNSNSQVPWQSRIIQEESILIFTRERR